MQISPFQEIWNWNSCKYIRKRPCKCTRTRTMMRSDEWAMTVNVASPQCAWRLTTRLKKRWSGLGLPFFRILLAVVSLKCSLPTVILDTWSCCNSKLQNEKLISVWRYFVWNELKNKQTNKKNLQDRVERFFAAVALWLLNSNHLIWRFRFDSKKMQVKVVDLLESFCSFHVIWLSTLLHVARYLRNNITKSKH